MVVQELLHLAGLFEADKIYFVNVKRVQKLANHGLSALLLLIPNRRH